MKYSRIILILLVPLLVFGLCTQIAHAYYIATAVENWDIEWDNNSGIWPGFYGQTSVWYYDGDSAQSADISDNQLSSFLGYTPYCPAGSQFRFVWKVSSEAGYDKLRFLINSVEMASISGEVNWQTKTFPAPVGYNTISWKYTKDSSISAGTDAGWVDHVEIISGVPTYSATIWSWILDEGWFSVPITMDGVPTGYWTGHTFDGLTGTHTFTVPSTQDTTVGQVTFYEWNTGWTGTTLTVNSAGTYTARYKKTATATLTVISPNGGEKWIRGTTHTLTWSSSGSPGTYVKIELMKSGVLNKVIASSTLNDGAYSWYISSTQTLGTDYKIRITSTSKPAITDSSNSNFAIVAGALTVTSPNGGQSWKHGTTHAITWSKAGSPGSYIKIELLKAGLVAKVIAYSTPNDGYYSWYIPSTQTPGTNYKIRITSTTYPSISDSSNSNFSIIT